MKFGDILGEANLSDDYRKVSRKVRLMYKTIRTGEVKIGKLIPDMVPFLLFKPNPTGKSGIMEYISGIPPTKLGRNSPYLILTKINFLPEL